MKITATIIVRDEEKDLPRAVKSLNGLIDEVVVVVDSRSKDRTSDVAKKLGAKVYVREFDNYAGQKNFAAEKASGEWILSLDADEEIPKELAKEIKRAIQSDEFDGYLIPRRNFLLGREIKHTRWSPDKHIWLYREAKGRWVGKIHEEVIVNGRVGELKEAKIHHSYETVSDFIDMVNSYTEFEAEEKIAEGEGFSFFKLFFYPARSFIGRYFYKKGFLDGFQGFMLSYLRAVYHLVSWIKVWEKSHA